jgi:hypothetical protein
MRRPHWFLGNCALHCFVRVRRQILVAFRTSCPSFGSLLAYSERIESTWLCQFSFRCKAELLP